MLTEAGRRCEDGENVLSMRVGWVSMGSTIASAERDTRVGKASVHWSREGSGPPIVFLHGFPLSGHTWDAVILHLRDRFTCYTPDLIGLGE